MRKPRFKPTTTPIFYHLYNRVGGHAHDRPFGPVEKMKFIEILHRLQQFFTVEIIAYQVMSNHFHLLVFAPAECPSKPAVLQRYKAYHGKRHLLDPNDPFCEILAERMRDISWFMHALQQQFSSWYNRSRPIPRRGTLWSQRYKHTLLGGAETIWQCWKYIEMNSVRAGLVQHPSDYRFSSFGAWSGSGRHPFEQNVQRRLMPQLGCTHLSQIQRMMSMAFMPHASQGLTNQADETNLLSVLDRRVKFWVEGLVIGSALFVREMIASSKGLLAARALDGPAEEQSHASILVYNPCAGIHLPKKRAAGP